MHSPISLRIIMCIELHALAGGGHYSRGATIAYTDVFWGDYSVLFEGATKQRGRLFEEIRYIL